QPFKLTQHMRQTHHWYGHGPVNFKEEVSGMAGGVHIDGYLKPIVVTKGWRGKDFAIRKSRSRSVSVLPRMIRPPRVRNARSETFSPEPVMSGALDVRDDDVRRLARASISDASSEAVSEKGGS